jgi:AcrR family transcriptional regulator
MRAVAKAAGTNTPAVYRRFRSREEMLRALVLLYQDELFKRIEPCASLPEIAQAYLDFALERPREYQLMMSGLIARMAKQRPTLDLVIDRATGWLGGTRAENQSLVYALTSLLHGCAMLTISRMALQQTSSVLIESARQAVEILIAKESKFRKSNAAAK